MKSKVLNINDSTMKINKPRFSRGLFINMRHGLGIVITFHKFPPHLVRHRRKQ